MCGGALRAQPGWNCIPDLYTNPCLRRFPTPIALQEEPVHPFLRVALPPPWGTHQRIRHDIRASTRKIQQEGRYRVVCSRRSVDIPLDDLEPEDVLGNPEADGDARFQLLDLVHEEGDPEASAAAADSYKVSTRSAEESWASPDKWCQVSGRRVCT